VEGLWSFGIKQVCPICRVDLPPGPEQLFEEATRRAPASLMQSKGGADHAALHESATGTQSLVDATARGAPHTAAMVLYVSIRGS